MKKNLIVGQSGGPSVAINATLAGIIAAAQKDGRIGKIYGSRHGIEGVIHDRVIDLTDFQELEKLKATPAPVGANFHRIWMTQYIRPLTQF